jgi:hypothetical protein
MKLFIAVQLLALILDSIIGFLDFTGYLLVNFIVHSFDYSINLELEFVILNQLNRAVPCRHVWPNKYYSQLTVARSRSNHVCTYAVKNENRIEVSYEIKLCSQ